MISARTKAALAAAKRRGVKLGGDRGARLTAKARAAACKLGLEGIVSKRRDSPYNSGRSRHWISKNPNAPAVKREAEEDWSVRR
jgi:bifunctional non-homologous end joining protein LigD